MIQPLAAPLTDYHGLIAGPDARIDLAAVVSTLGQQRFRFSGLVRAPSKAAANLSPKPAMIADLSGGFDAYLARLEALQRSVPSSRTIGASDVAAGRFGTLQQIVAELGLAWDEDAARAFVEPAAWHAPGPHQSEAAAP